jgi:Uma2 family endonuclease
MDDSALQTTTSPATTTAPKVTWDPLSADYVLPDDPVDNFSQLLLAAALRESLELAGLITPEILIATNFGLCATVDNKTVVKAPDWAYVPRVELPPANQTRRSYTPHLEGDPPVVVIEFLSETEGGEYSMNPNYPYGKWWFYERILQVPTYLIFHPDTGALESYQLLSDHYQPQVADANGQYWLAALGLHIGVWQGTKADRTGYWLRWWDSHGNLLPWGTECLEQERQRSEQERLAKERLAAKLRELGIDPNQVA